MSEAHSERIQNVFGEHFLCDVVLSLFELPPILGKFKVNF